MDKIQLQRRAEKFGTAAKWGAGIAGAVIISPIIFLAVKGIIGLALAVGAGFAVTQYAPVLGMKVKNHKLKMIKAEAAKNPVETAQNVQLSAQARHRELTEKVSVFSGKYRTFCDRVAGLEKRFPGEAVKFDEQKASMKELLERRKLKVKRSAETLELLAIEIEKASMVWDTTLAMRDARQAGEGGEEEAIEKIKLETALYSIQDQLNIELGELEQDLLEEPAEVKQLPAAQQREKVDTKIVDAEVIPVTRRKS